MLKRKQFENSNSNSNSTNPITYDLQYYEPTNCDKISLKNRDIYFSSLISDKTITQLIQFIQFIKNNEPNNTSTIYIHITSKGGFISSLYPFIQFKSTYNYHLTSIINGECDDAAIILSNICDYRIITKNSVCKFSQYHNLNNKTYWGYFMQENMNFNQDGNENSKFLSQLYDLFLNHIKSKFNTEKLNNLFNHLLNNSNINQNIWNSKKYKKLGLADEIINL